MAKVMISLAGETLEGNLKIHENPNAPLVILYHPHPLYGGNMNSKTLYHMEQAFLDNNFSTLKFNFRGCGKSSGNYGYGKEEVLDASIVLDWVLSQSIHPKNIWVAGFSFGAYIASHILIRRVEIYSFILVGLPVNMFELSFLYPSPINGMFISAGNDEIVPLPDIEKLVNKITQSPSVNIEHTIIPDADHFYKNSFSKLYDTINNYLIQNNK